MRNDPIAVYAPDPVRVASDAFANHNKNGDGTSQSISSSGGGKDSDRPGTWGQPAQPVYNRPVAENKPTEPVPEKLTDKPAPNNPTPTLTPPKTLAPDPVTAPVNSAKPTDPNSRRPSNLHIDVPTTKQPRLLERSKERRNDATGTVHRSKLVVPTKKHPPSLPGRGDAARRGGGAPQERPFFGCQAAGGGADQERPCCTKFRTQRCATGHM